MISRDRHADYVQTLALVGASLDRFATEIRNLQPVPPPYVWTDGNGDKVDAYLRFKNMYLNENRLDQPDLILDVILRAPPANAAELLESAPPPTVSTSPFGLVEP